MAPSGWPTGSGGGGNWPPTGSGGGSWPPTGAGSGQGWPAGGSTSGGAGWPPGGAAGSGGNSWPPAGQSGGQQWPPASIGSSWPAGAAGTATAQQPDWAAGFAPSGDGGSTESARPPLLWLYLGFVGPLLGIGLLFLSGWMWNVLGWFVSIALGLGMLVVFTGADLKRRANPWYLARPGLVGILRLAVVVASIAVAGVHAYLLADYIARLDVWVP